MPRLRSPSAPHRLPSERGDAMSSTLWKRYLEYVSVSDSIGLTVDVSRMSFPDGFFAQMHPLMERAFAEMDALEKGAVANPDEKRLVGHYWLRDPARAPSMEIRAEIADTIQRVRRFARDVHSGRIRGEPRHFTNLLAIGLAR